MGSLQLGIEGRSVCEFTWLPSPKLSPKITTLPFKDNVSLFAISGDGAVVTFTVTRPEVRNDDVRLKIDSDNFFFAIETFAKYLN